MRDVLLIARGAAFWICALVLPWWLLAVLVLGCAEPVVEPAPPVRAEDPCDRGSFYYRLNLRGECEPTPMWGLPPHEGGE